MIELYNNRHSCCKYILEPIQLTLCKCKLSWRGTRYPGAVGSRLLAPRAQCAVEVGRHIMQRKQARLSPRASGLLREPGLDPRIAGFVWAWQPNMSGAHLGKAGVARSHFIRERWVRCCLCFVYSVFHKYKIKVVQLKTWKCNVICTGRLSLNGILQIFLRNKEK